MITKQKAFNRAVSRFYAGKASGDVKIVVRSSKNKQRKIKIAIINGIDDVQVSSVAMSNRGGLCDIVLLRNTLGYTIIQTRRNGTFRFNLGNVIRNLRIREARAIAVENENEPVIIPDDLLYVEGTVSAAEAWYYHKPVESILNGSSTHPDVKKTLLSLQAVSRILTEAVEYYLSRYGNNKK